MQSRFNETKLISVKEASYKLTMGYSTLIRLVNKNPNVSGVYKIGNSYKIDLNKFLEDKEVEKSIKEIGFAKLRRYYENESSYYSTLSIKTVKSHRKSLKDAEEFFFKNDFNKENLYKFKDHLIKNRKLAQGTVKKYLDALSKMCDIAVNAGLINDNIVEGLQKGLKTGVIERFLTKEERERLKVVASPDILDYIEFAIETGLRKGEQFNLTWDRVDFDKKEIYITDRKNGKNLTLPISPYALSILKQRRDLRVPFKDKHYSSFQEVISKARIHNFRWHDLRHTFATWCIKGWHSWLNGKPLPLHTIKQLLGHSRITMTERYSHLDASDLRNIFN